MGLVKTLKGDDGKPYISLEDMINTLELELDDLESTLNEDNEVVEVVEKILNALIDLKKQYYKTVKKSGSKN